jgi:spectinomycin phosphotransferase
VQSLPADLAPELVATTLAEAWRLPAAPMQWVPEGGGSYHWKLGDERSLAHFVTVDDLDAKDWLGDTRRDTFDGMRRALGTAAALRSAAGLDFVVAAVPACDGALLRRLDDRYAVSVFPYLAGRSHQFGRYQDAGLQRQAVDMIAALHQATASVTGEVPRHVPSFQGRAGLAAFLADPDQRWHGGPCSEPARQLLQSRAADIARLTAGFDRLVAATAAAREATVITHGEPHPGNVMSVNGRLMLIDWDTVALAPPERDVCLIAAADDGDGVVGRYQQATGRELDPAILTLYRVRWYLDDLGSAISMFRNEHRDTAGTRRWLDALAAELAQLSGWLARLG